MINFFKPEEETLIIAAIRKAEAKTSGEIRVHLEQNTRSEAMREAKRIFRKLDMHKTKDRNGVLILMIPEQKTFAIIGDKGIDEVVEENFWESERDLIQGYFREGHFCAGLVAAIDQIGTKLKAFFPLQEDDQNELPDDISYGAKDI
ncbi:MAG: TPM domain-containing protein [Bacteroidota bacterium]